MWDEIQADLPHPLLQVLRRVETVAAEERAERFLSLMYLFEASLKYDACWFHSFIAVADPEEYTRVGYAICHQDGLGGWLDQINRMIAYPLGPETPSVVHQAAAAYAGSINRREDALGQEAIDNVKSLLLLVGSGATLNGARVPSLISALITVRNKTRGHGALPGEKYQRGSELLEPVLAYLLHRSPTRTAARLVEVDTPDSQPPLIRTLHGPGSAWRVAREWSDCGPGLFLVPSGDALPCAVSPLMRLVTDSGVDEYYFANGRLHSSDSSSECLNYRSGSTRSISFRQFRARPAPLPKSHTSGSSGLVRQGGTLQNVPERRESYVNRPILEQQLARLLRNNTHRMLTLHGPGGAGKTSLALTVSRSLIDDAEPPFSAILWFSARDVDLLNEGPAPRSRDVRSIEEVAESFCRLMGGMEKGEEALEAFALTTGDYDSRMLLIMDNFETLDDPVEVQTWLDETVVLPNKVLITSRLRAFQGDYVIDVAGMERDEAEELLRIEARRVGKEPLLTPETIKNVISYTGAIPYAMKLVVGQIDGRRNLAAILDQSVSSERVLDALFTRSYRGLSRSSRHLFLLVGAARSDIPAYLARVALGHARADFDDALDGCLRASLLVETVDDGVGSLLSMPAYGKKFAAAYLEAAIEREAVYKSLELVKAVRGANPTPLAYAQQIRSIIEGNAAADNGELLEILEILAREEPVTGRVYASALALVSEDHAHVRDVFEASVAHYPRDYRTLFAWALFELRTEGGADRAVSLMRRAAEYGKADLEFCSTAAAELAAVMRRSDVNLSVDQRRPVVGVFISVLESHTTRLTSVMMSRLAWLYLLVGQEHEAERCAQRGLDLDPRDKHCQRIVERLRSAR